MKQMVERDPDDCLDDPVTREVIGCAIAIHRVLGPGLLESAYQACLAHEFGRRGLSFKKELALPVVYEGVRLDCGYRLDFLVAESVVVEVKCVDAVSNAHLAQLLTYLRLSGAPRGLIINFHEALLKDGIYRRVLSFPKPMSRSSSSASSASLR
jgi:GxxExxY protein